METAKRPNSRLANTTSGSTPTIRSPDCATRYFVEWPNALPITPSHSGRWYADASECAATYASHVGAPSSSRTTIGIARSRLVSKAIEESISPVVRERNGPLDRLDRLSAAEQVVHRGKAKLAEQQTQSFFGLVQVPVMAKTSERPGRQARLLRIDFPRV